MTRSRSTINKKRPQLEMLEDRCLLTGPAQYGSADAFKQFLINQALTQYQNLFGQTFSSGVFFPPGWYGVAGAAGAGGVAVLPEASVSSNSNASFSHTNNQVPGVDEGDIVQTDGNYIYYMRGQELVIAQAWPASSLSIVSTTPLTGYPAAMYLNGNRLTIISSVGGQFKVDPGAFTTDGFPLLYSTWAKTEISVYDVSDPTKPSVVQNTFMDGSYTGSREVGTVIYVVQTNWSTLLPAPAYTSFNGQVTYVTQADYLQEISGHELDLALAHFYTLGSDGNLQPAGLITDPAQIFEPQTPNDTSLVSVVAFDVTGANPVGTVSMYANYTSTLYASPNHLYIAAPQWNANGTTSEIYQLNLNGTQVSLNAAGSVPGYIISQFALDESGADLRVVTNNWGTNATNGLYVLEADQGMLNIVGSVQGLGPNGIEAVRFVGDNALISNYALNYTSTNSVLQVVSVATSASPQVIGSLSMTGNLSYMQSIDATHVIGIGEDSSTGIYTVQVVLLNLGDPTVPSETDHFDLQPTAGSQLSWGLASPAQWDAHAVGYFPEYQTLAIPVYGTYTGINWTGYESQLWVFNVDPNNGFTLEGQVTQDSQVERSLRIGDQLYAVADDSIDVVPIQNPTAPPIEARIADQPRFPIFYPYWATPGIAYAGAVLNFSVASTAGLTATIAWGDGTSSTGTIAPAASGGFAVAGVHTYSGSGNFTPSVTFSRNGTTVDSLNGTVNVTDVSTPVANYVDHLYQNLLGRHADQSGMENFGGQLTKGTITKLQVVQGITNSVEYRTDQIDQFYVTLLGRQADAGGLQGYLALLASGGTLNQVRTIMLGSPEYFHHVSGTDVGFLQALYLNVLGRSIDPTGAILFGAAMSKGMTTKQVADIIMGSNESANDLVEGFYQEAFHRAADPSGWNTFTSAMEHGASGEAVLAVLFASDEFWQKNSA